MELQLGLALALPTNTTTTKGFDLNSYAFEPKDTAANRQLFTTTTKRSFRDAFEEIPNEVEPRTLPLLHWNNQPNEDDGPHNTFPFARDEGEGDGIVGWPPIKFRRTKISHRRQNSRVDSNRTVDNGCVDCYGRASNSMYIKVKMEGVAIGRKIDLSIYSSFQPLKQALFEMFGICEENSDNYKLTYQDREGDWLLADDDVSWRSFIRSVQRLKLMRRGAAAGG
ncbi:hypothetical protein JCGZ_17040 [Jatropha curcas]|uniref:Auxin-responsive protein n=2 Tax=Jatropha curcas TaxID=180498 RepID=A0A067K5I1_JATCU|nr:hypothetical protein JCGZ_17040 [Jatropha curcas]